MKRKFFLSLISVLLGGICLTASACSCTPTQTLSLTSDWNNNSNTIGYKETAVYSVEHVADFNSDGLNYAVSDALKDDVTFSFSNGTYTVSAQIVPATTSFIPSRYTGNIQVESGQIIHLTTEFKITSSYTYGNPAQTKTSNDFIKTDSYICTVGASYTPLYVTQENKYAILSVSDQGTNVAESHFKREFIYSTDKYVINEINVDDNSVKAFKEYKDTYRTAIDNFELLFPFRKVNIENVDGIFSLPTISATYGAPQTIKISRLEDATENVNLTANGTPYTQMQVRKYVFNVDNQMMAGKSQLVFIQAKPTEQTSTVDYRAHVVKYVEPLTVYGSFAPMGALVYSLQSVTYGK